MASGAGSGEHQSGATAPAQVRAPETGGASSLPKSPAPAANSGTPPAESDDGPILLSEDTMASMQFDQVRKVDLTRLDAQDAKELASASPQARRRSIFGSADDDTVLKMYIDGWRRAVERNGNRSFLPSSPGLRGDPVVTVAIRRDGSIESVAVDRSTPELEAAVRQIIQSSESRDAFPPDLRRRYDVIEIRRRWRFGDTLRIVEETR